jgi:hypothetical protein
MSGTGSVLQSLLVETAEFPVIDTHEHIPAEHVRTSSNWDIFSLMFESYVGGDLLNAGLSPRALDIVQGSSATVDEKWELLRPVWPLARQTTYGRVISLSLRRFFQEDDFAHGGARRATERLRARNRPGIYPAVIRDACGIQKVLTQRDDCAEFLGEEEADLFALVVRPPGLGTVDRSVVELQEKRVGKPLRSLAEFLESVRPLLARHARAGAVGLKIASWNMGLPEPASWELAGTLCGFEDFPPVSGPTVQEAEPAFDRMMNAAVADVRPEDHWLLCGATMHFLAGVAEELGLVICVHTGAAWKQWIDFRLFRPAHIIPLLAAHPGARFDVYHAGIPWQRELAMMSKIFPNCWINLAWAHIISPEMTVTFMDELLDMVPPNKMLGFGGDYRHCVENLYGHLVIARENIARVLSRRVERGLLSMDQAIEITHAWLWDNPIDLYRLSVDQPA